jgi:hypothetical protein
VSQSLVAKKILRVFSLFFITFVTLNQCLLAQGFSIIQTITPLTATSTTEDKPQSKVWKYGDYWWTVIPVPASGGDLEGTYLFRLDGLDWTKILPRLDPAINIHADIKSISGVTHILLKENGNPSVQQAKLISIEFVSGSPPTYQLWSLRNTTVSFNIPSFAETATIDIDSLNRMWLATDGGASGNKNVYALWSDSPYSSWSSPILLASSIKGDDICAVTAFGGNKIGVLWSDQNAHEFRFRYRYDSDLPNATWQNFETAASGFNADTDQMPDDHINLAVDSRDGTIYAAIKTSYDISSGEVGLGLLVRSNTGVWQLHEVVASEGSGTRPIALLNENDNVITVCYTSSNANDDILFKESSINTISFPVNEEVLFGGSNNNPSSTKQNIGDDAVIVFSEGNLWRGVKTYRPPIIVENGAGLAFDFHGINDEAIVVSPEDNGPLESISTTITLECWIKPDAQNNQHLIFYQEEDPADGGYALLLTSDGTVQFKIRANFTLESISNYPTGKWTHIAVTYNQSQSSVRLYINGKLDASGNYTSTLGDGNDFIIGARDTYDNPPAPAYDQTFNGTIDEIKVWNVSRTENEIREFMCQKIDENDIPGSLIAYWNFDTPRGLTLSDETSNLNNGIINGIADFRFEWSGAAIGDESESDYTLAGGSFFVEIGHVDGDHLEVTASGSSGATGIQVYRVDAPSLYQGFSGVLPGAESDFDEISPLRYYGVKVIGSSSATYDVVYDYTGHPGAFVDESNLKLAYRNNLNDNSWEDLNAILDVGQNTLSKQNLPGTEFALASTGNNPLPVELSSFTGRIINNAIKLNWRTETETLNYGFDVEKSVDGINFNKIAFVEGHGNSNSPKIYSYSDPLPTGHSGNLYYRLKQIDTDGSYTYSQIVEVEIGLPVTYELFQNYPNPFNPATTIRFQIPEKARVTLKIFNALGEEVTELLNEEKEAGYYEANFNASSLASGVYIYTLMSNGYFSSKKMLLVK